MQILIVVSDTTKWPLQIPGVDVVDARSYLTLPEYSDRRATKVFNLCKSYRYQSAGYYVSLLAEARGHKPLPSVMTIQDLRSQSMIRLVSDDLQDLIQQSLKRVQQRQFTLSVYFGRNVDPKYDRLALQLFNMFQAPMLRAQFARENDTDLWELRSVSAIATSEVPMNHRETLTRVAGEYFAGRGARPRRKARHRYDLAILANPGDPSSPSDEDALKRFERAAERAGMSVELIGRDDFARLSEFDALFIRETTMVNHHTYRFARRAASEGLVVIDDPESIVRCSNKVFLAEAMIRAEVRIPKTVVAHNDNADEIGARLGYPCVLKRPDSAFSQGVVKVNSPDELRRQLDEFLEKSDLVIAQEFLPTQFDWRIGVLDGKPLYACKYYMADNHWQIVKHDPGGRRSYGKVETLHVELAPRKAVRAALAAADLIGDGLYGVDVKQSGGQFYVIEVNDNPNLDAGIEDQKLGKELYDRIMGSILRRIEHSKQGRSNA